MLIRTVQRARLFRLGVGGSRAQMNGSKNGASRFLSSSGAEETSLFSWGIGTDGQLGHGRFQKISGTLGSQDYVQEEPRKLVKSKRFKSVSPGSGFTLGLSHDGELFGWGSEFLKGCQSNEPTLISVPFVNKGAKVVSISAGEKHACVVDSDGFPYSWGYGGSWFSGGGMLGHGDKDEVPEPRLIEHFKNYGAKIKEVSCGGSHTLFLTDDGEVLTCGVGEYGRQGTGSNDDSLVPSPVEALLDEDVVRVAAGYDHSLVLTAKGNVFTWGRNNLGQLGHYDSYIDIYSMEDFPRKINQDSILLMVEDQKGLEKSSRDGKDPVTFKEIAAGNGRSAAITTDGSLYVWGGRISHMPKLFDRNDNLFGGEACVKVRCGGDAGKAVVAAVTESGALYTFGDGGSKMLGTKGLSGKHPLPTKIKALEEGVVDVACGFGSHIFAFVKVPPEV